MAERARRLWVWWGNYNLAEVPYRCWSCQLNVCYSFAPASALAHHGVCIKIQSALCFYRSAGSYFDVGTNSPKLVEDRITRSNTVASAVAINSDGDKLIGAAALQAADTQQIPPQNCIEGFKRLLGKRWVHTSPSSQWYRIVVWCGCSYHPTTLYRSHIFQHNSAYPSNHTTQHANLFTQHLKYHIHVNKAHFAQAKSWNKQ